MITVLYFAALRERFQCAEETLELPSDVKTVGALQQLLSQRGGLWQILENGTNIRMAINQTMADSHDAIGDGDEIAFFPPVTGG